MATEYPEYDELFKEFESLTPEDLAPPEVDSSFDPNDYDALFAEFDEIESEEFLQETQAERESVLGDIESKRIQEEAERGDIFSETLPESKSDITTLDFPEHEITPSVDETTIASRFKAAGFDLKAAGSELGQRTTTGRGVNTASGFKPGQEGYEQEVLEENRRGLGILEAVRDATGEDFAPESFEYGRLFPTTASLEPVKKVLQGMELNEEEAVSALDDVRSYLARFEQERKTQEGEIFQEKSEKFFPMEARVHRVLDRLQFVKDLPENDAFDSLRKGFFEGTLEHDIAGSIGWLAATNPKKGAELSKIFTMIKDELASDQVNKGRVVQFSRDVAKIIGPMVKTMAFGGALPIVGPIISAESWMSSETGSIFEELIQAGMDPEEAAMNSVIGGIASGAIEQLQMGRLKNLVTNFGGGKLKKIFAEGIKDFIKKKGVKAGKKYLTEWGTQVGQEMTQKLITSIAAKTSIREAGLSRDDVSDIFLNSLVEAGEEGVEVAPEMAAVTAISMLLGVSIVKIRSSKRGPAKTLSAALEEKGLDNTLENAMKVMQDDPGLQQRIKESFSLSVEIDGANSAMAAVSIEGEITAQKVQEFWKKNYKIPLTHESAKEKAENITTLRESYGAELTAEKEAAMEEFFKPIIEVAEERAESLKEIDKILFSKNGVIEDEVHNNRLKEMKSDLAADEKDLTRKNVVAYWAEATGERLTRKEAMGLIAYLNTIEEVAEEEIVEDEAVTPPIEEEIIAPTEVDVEAPSVEEEIVSRETLEEVTPPIEEEIAPEIADVSRETLVEEFGEDLVSVVDQVMPEVRGVVSGEVGVQAVKDYWDTVFDTKLTEEDAQTILEIESRLEGREELPLETTEDAAIEEDPDEELSEEEVEALLGPESEVSPEAVKELVDTVESTEVAEEEFLTEEGKEQTPDETLLFSINKDGTVETQDDPLILEKAISDINYFIPKELMSKIKVRRVDNIMDGSTALPEESRASVHLDKKTGDLIVQLRNDLSIAETAKTLYHEIMGHAGINNVINNNSTLYKQSQILFQSKEAKESVRGILEDYQELYDSLESKHSKQVADDMLYSEWLAHEMADYMENRVEGSIGHKLWNLFKAWLVRNGWANAKNSEELMMALTEEMRKLPPAKLQTDFMAKYEGPALSFSLSKDFKKKTQELARRLKETKKREREKRETIKEETRGKRETLAKVTRERREKKEVEHTAEKKKIREEEKVKKDKLEIKLKEEARVARRKLLDMIADREIKIEELHKEIIEYGKSFLKSKEDRFELEAYLRKVRPKTAAGLIGAKNRSVEKLHEMITRQRRRVIEAGLIKTLKSAPREMTADEKKAFNDIARRVKINEMTPEQMLDTKSELDTIIYESVSRQKAFIKGKIVDKEKLNDEMFDEVKGFNTLRELSIGAEASIEERRADRFYNKWIDTFWGLGALTPKSIVATRMVGKEGGSIEKAITGAMSNSLTETLRVIQNVGRKMETTFGDRMKQFENMSTVFYRNKHKAVKNIGEKVRLSGGRVMKITPGQRISFILHDLNDHNYSSILKEGIIFDTALGGDVVKITKDDFAHILSTATEIEKDVAKFFHGILNNESKQALLETSKKIQGYEMEVVDNYFPLHRTDLYQEYLLGKTSQGELKTQINAFLETTGSLKGRVKNAKGTVIIEDAFKTFYDSMKFSASYQAYAPALRTAKQALNDLNKEVGKKYGIRKEIIALQKYISDIEGTVVSNPDQFEKWMKIIMGNLASGALGLNVTVIARQLPSYMTIATEIGPEHMLKGATLPFSVIGKQSKAEEFIANKIEQYAPQIHQRITKGTINAELGDRASVNEAGSFFGKSKTLAEMSTAGIEWADTRVMMRIVKASQSKVEKDSPTLTGDAKWESIMELAQRLIENTQPMYSREHRSLLSRSKSPLTRLVFSFTSVTNQLFNVYARSWMRFKTNPNRKQAWTRFVSDMFWLNISATIAMTGIDELKDLAFGEDPTWNKRTGRVLKFLLSPLYLSSGLTSAAQDYLDSLDTGRWSGWNLKMANSNLILGTLTNLIRGGVDLGLGLQKDEFGQRDKDRIMKGFINITNETLKTFTGVAPKNLDKYTLKLIRVDRNKPKVISIARKLKYIPSFSQTMMKHRKKYKIDKEAFENYQKRVHLRVQARLELEGTFGSKSDADKVKFLKKYYKRYGASERRQIPNDDLTKALE